MYACFYSKNLGKFRQITSQQNYTILLHLVILRNTLKSIYYLITLKVTALFDVMAVKHDRLVFKVLNIAYSFLAQLWIQVCGK